MIKFLVHKIASCFGHRSHIVPEGRVFVFYARKLSVLIFVSSLLAVGVVGFGLSSYRSQQVFKEEPPIRQGDERHKKVSLTVNVDWGEEYLPEMLALFQQQQVRVTFFMTGRWAQENGPLVKRVVQEGHDIGNHGWSHPHVNDLSLDENLQEIRRTEDILYQLTSRRSKFFAPPYGEYNETVLAAASGSNLRTVLWSIDTVDWQNPTPQWIVRRILDMSHNGAIVLMHPTPVTVKALPEMITGLRKQGYEIVPLEKLLPE